MQPELLRYSCQLALPGFGEVTQQRLLQAKVLVVGIGGLGCPSAQYLASTGVGTIGLADFDTISTSNLHRQVLFIPKETGLKKVTVAAARLQQQNPGITIIPHDVKITSENVFDIIMSYELVIDCTDNFESRYLLNDACVLTGKPLVYGAIYQYEGQVAVWNLLNKDGTRTPNYRDLFPDVNAAAIPGCADGGVMPALAGIIGCMQANEAIKYFTGQQELLAGKILMFDAQTLQSHIIKLGAVTKTSITSLPATVPVPVISVNDLKEVFDKNIYDLIDVRTAGERELFHIGGTHIPLHELDVNLLVAKPARALVVYCSSGSRSAEAVRQIKKKFPALDVFSLEGGLQAWEEEGGMDAGD